MTKTNTELSGVITDLCHVLGVDMKRVQKIEIMAQHLELWIYDEDRNLSMRMVRWRS
jgi:hypothetical protein